MRSTGAGGDGNLHYARRIQGLDVEQTRRGCVFFFQAEDGIRDIGVTGVQTCALPICDNYLLVIAMHHVISDGWSVGVFSNELSALYKAFKAGQPSPLPPLQIQYADFARWQREHLAIEAAEQLTYWKRQLAGRLPVLALPSERSRLPMPAQRVATESTTLPPALIHELKEFSSRNGATLFMTLLTAFQ